MNLRLFLRVWCSSSSSAERLPVLPRSVLAIRRCLLIGVLSLLMAACAGVNFTPTDYESIYSPAIVGTLRMNDKPVVDAEIVLAPVSGPSAQCYFEKRKVRTDENGRFSISALLATEAGDMALETEYRWQVCVIQPDGKRAIWFDSIAGRLSPNALVEVACDLADKPQDGSICRLVDNGEIDLTWPELNELNN